MFRAPCAHHQEVKIVFYSIWYHHTCRWPSSAQVERRLLLVNSTADGCVLCSFASWIVAVYSYVNIGRYYLFNPLNAELNPICHLLALLGTHHILHISRIRVNPACFLYQMAALLLHNFILVFLY